MGMDGMSVLMRMELSIRWAERWMMIDGEDVLYAWRYGENKQHMVMKTFEMAWDEMTMWINRDPSERSKKRVARRSLKHWTKAGVGLREGGAESVYEGEKCKDEVGDVMHRMWSRMEREGSTRVSYIYTSFYIVIVAFRLMSFSWSWRWWRGRGVSARQQ